ncbi:DEKNAAC102422 [Brettanomyces naardenensis]|uniref:V-type proton ATPase subunit a n=1 Tax=Brettanomyces naardenensis TaxID=13370 RepID=A0A448YL25_BRENA|nr:DEKNAAC102422 [Brettanomyces naardenensis]
MSDAIFRSADMVLVQFYIASEIARECVSVLGELGDIQFRDMNKSVNAFQRSFVKETRKFDNTERQLRYLESVIDKQHVPIVTTSYDDLIRKSTLDLEDLASRQPPTTSQMDTLSRVISDYEHNVREMADTYNDLLSRQFDLLEHRTVLQGTRSFFDARLSPDIVNESSELNRVRLSTDGDEESLLVEEEPLLDSRLQLEHSTSPPPPAASNEMTILGSSMNFICGTIDTDKYLTLERILWRSLRGNLYLNKVPIEEPIRDPATGEDHYRCIFVLFTHGSRLIERCRKIVESLDGKLFDVSPDYEEYRRQLVEVNDKLTDLDSVLDHTSERLVLELKEIALEIERWRIEISKEKAIYATLNLFDYDPTRRCLIAEGWMPKSDLSTVKSALRDVTERCGTDINTVVNVIHTNRTPPTFFRTNKFTSAFQTIVDAYGIASYQEINPGLPAIVTFPFMFAIMFGDMGHGFLLFLAASILILKEGAIAKMKNREEIFDMAYTGRYILVMMGLFSMYTGFMYNDLFSRDIPLFKSGWKWPSDFKEGQSITATQVGVYPIGLDSAWHAAENALLFANSYKMKLSILMGFIHMSYSLQLSLFNYRFFKSRIDIIGNYIPGFLFMHAIFGYLCITIVYKWSVNWIADNKPPPSLLNMLINMFLSPGYVDEQLFPGQKIVQVVLMLIAVVCVPWLLLFKPLALKRQNDTSIRLGYTDIHEASTADNTSLQTITTHGSSSAASTSTTAAMDNFMIEDYNEPPPIFDFGDVMINQVIHTIEFCLNCVSHTASYLRLWALSLAHNQLSSVLWDMTLKNSFVEYSKRGFAGCLIVFFIFGLWFILTVGVLVCMEGTSAMLHSLRLHWVEAMSKHFEGEGYQYTPFAFHDVLTLTDDSSAPK